MLSTRRVFTRKYLTCEKYSFRSYKSGQKDALKTRSNRKYLSSNELRSSFIDFFVQNHGHDFVRSSPVKPSTHDQSLLFVNAGMNQFKPIFLDQLHVDDTFANFRRLNRAVNSQKCIRVGGKHCDLNNVGKDFTHHTFFEMLGNWSFNDYFKKEACEMALTLLTQVYGIDKSRLIVTIFAGDSSLNLPRDDEAYDIWRSIGVSSDRIIELGIKDNFWEMGETGPCGICTEIHYQPEPFFSGTTSNEVRKNTIMERSIEIWNLVFIQYFRDKSGTLNRLAKNYVDTGMGLERILPLVQGVSNNYQTDLFTPYFDKIHKITRWPKYSGTLEDRKDIAYRILADHSRMASISIADGIVCDDRGSGYLLRRVIRRAVDSIRQVSPLPPGTNEITIFDALVDTTIETLGDAYPELKENINNIKKIIEHEIHYYNTAFGRDLKIMKISNQLELSLTENRENNMKNILSKCENIDKKLNAMQDNMNSTSRPIIQQKELNQSKDVIESLSFLMNNKLANRFGFVNKDIELSIDSLKIKHNQLQTVIDKANQAILESFQNLTIDKIQNNDHHSILEFSNNLFNYSNIDFLLLKYSSDFYGNKLPLIVFLNNSDDTEVLIKITIPYEYQNIITAEQLLNKCFDKTISLYENNKDIKSFVIKNNRNMKKAMFCRIICNDGQTLRKIKNDFHRNSIEVLDEYFEKIKK